MSIKWDSVHVAHLVQSGGLLQISSLKRVRADGLQRISCHSFLKLTRFSAHPSILWWCSWSLSSCPRTHRSLTACWSLPLVCSTVSLNSPQTCIWTASIILILCGKWTVHLAYLFSHYHHNYVPEISGRKRSHRGAKITECIQIRECAQHPMPVFLGRKWSVWCALPALR